jgi:hypothetical protein
MVTTTVNAASNTAGLRIVLAVAALVALGSAERVLCATCPDFAPAVNYAGGSRTQAVTTADFNGDGALDLAATNALDCNVSIMLGRGDGTFMAAVNVVPLGCFSQSIVAGDVNRDGKADLVLANLASGSVSILLGAGDGTFAASTTVVPFPPYSVELGDVNGDGDADLAVSNGNAVSIMLGNGTGTFAAPVSYATGMAAYAVAIGDVNGDAAPDLAVANRDSSTVSVLLGAGDGTFAAAVNYVVSGSPVSVAIGDLNADGKPDLVVGNQAKVAVLIGNGSGGFAAPVNYDAGMFPFAVAIGDINNDGKPDLAVAEATNSTTNVWILAGNGNGTFAAAVGYGVGSLPESLAIGDFNRDGRLDLATANRLDNNVSVLLNSGACAANCGAFAVGVTYDTSFGSNAAVIGDLNSDGKPDLAVANLDSNNVSVLLGNGSGTFAAAVNYGMGSANGPWSLAIGDVNRDARPDLVTANYFSANVSILLGNGDGTFGGAVHYAAGTNPVAVAVEDLNGDAKPDLAVANVTSNNVSILIGNGDGTFPAPVNYAVTAPRSVALADLNRDGQPDMVVASAPNTVTIRLGNGDGTFGAAASFGAGTLPYSVAVGDLNQDGKADLAVANRNSDDVSVLLGDGSGAFASAVNHATGSHPQSIAVGDVNGDGKPDLAVANRDSYTVSILMGAGNGTFAPAVNYEAFGITASHTADAVAIGDVNLDGRADLAVPAGNAGEIKVLINTCPDLTVTKFHTGTFTQGQAGATYTINVNNVSSARTSGTITMTDTLPAGLIATAMSGSGWTCTLASLACTRSDRVIGLAPTITLTVTVRSNAPSNVTNTATVSGGNQLNTTNDTASDPTTIASAAVVAPTGVVATADSTAQITITWDSVSFVIGYELTRIANGSAITIPATGSTYIDTAVTANTAYVYQVRAVNTSGGVGPASAPDAATTMLFTDDPLAAGSHVVKAVHLTELQAGVNAMRAAAGLAPATFRAVAPGDVVAAADVTELRSSLDQARNLLGLPAMTYSDPALAAGDVIKAVHFQEIRNALK